MREERSDGKQLPRSLDLDIVFMVLFFSIFRRNIFYHMFFYITLHIVNFAFTALKKEVIILLKRH